MKIILAATPATGHVDPVLGIARVLANRGHRAIVYTGSAFADRVWAAGCEFAPLPPSVDFDLRDNDLCFPARAQLDGIEILRHDFEHVFVGPMRAQYEGLSRLMDDVEPDMIVADHLFMGVLPIWMKPRGARPFTVSCGVTFLGLPRADGLPHGPGLPFVDLASERASLEALLTPEAMAILGPLQTIYEDALRDLGIEPCGDALSAAAVHADLFLQAGVPETEYPLDEQPANLRFAGLWPPVPATAEIPHWASAVEDSRRVVLVTQGTVANSNLDQLVLPTMRAFASRPDVLVIGTAGGRDVSQYDGDRDLPANARLESYLPMDWLLPHVDVLVTNGGFGNILKASAQGVPMVIAGTTEDKPEIAARMARAGIGVDLRTATPTEAMLRTSIDAVLREVGYRDRANAIAASFARHDSEALVDEVARDLEAVGMIATQ
jgi:UDP:flavonoid glycosyltransferase YjiC (YdhE family)